MFVMACLWMIFSSYPIHAANLPRVKPSPNELRQFLEPILQTQPRYLAAQAALDAIKAKYAAASKAIYNPELELDSQKTDIRTSFIGLSQTIDWGDQRGARTHIAQFQLEAANAEFELARQKLVRDLVLSLITYQNSARLAALSKQRLQAMKEFLDLAKKKYTTGDLNLADLNLAQLSYSDSLLNHARVLAEQADAEQAFSALYGTLPRIDALPPIESTFEFPLVNTPDDLDSFVLSLPQMQSVRANVAATKGTIQLQESISSADPTIAVRGGKEDQQSLAGITLTIPLNIRNNYSDDIQVARQDYLESEQLAQQAYRNTRRGIVSSAKRYQLIRAAWQQWQDIGAVSLNNQLTLLNRLWRAGDLSTTDYLVQFKQNLQTQAAAISLNTTLWSNWLDWLLNTAQLDTWLDLSDKRNP